MSSQSRCPHRFMSTRRHVAGAGSRDRSSIWHAINGCRMPSGRRDLVPKGTHPHIALFVRCKGPWHGLWMDEFNDCIRLGCQEALAAEVRAVHFVAQGGRSARLVSKTPPELMGRNAVVRHNPCRFRMTDRRSGSAGSCSPRAVCAQRELVHPV